MLSRGIFADLSEYTSKCANKHQFDMSLPYLPEKCNELLQGISIQYTFAKKFADVILCPVKLRLYWQTSFACVQRMYLLLYQETHNFVKFQYCRWTMNMTRHIPTSLLLFELRLIFVLFVVKTNLNLSHAEISHLLI